MNVSDVLIVGGGIIGLTTAYHLAAHESCRVTVVDRGDLGQEASWAGAGIVPPGVSSRAANPLDRLRAETAEQLPALSDDLRHQTGIDNGYFVCGGVEFLDEHDSESVGVWRAETLRVESLSHEDARQRWPGVEPPSFPAWYLPDTAQVRNPRHMKALIAACAALGVRLLPHTPVTGFDTVGDRVVAVHTRDGTLSAGQFVLAAGAWSDGVAQSLGVRLPVWPVLGQIVLFHASPTVRPVIGVGKRYLVPRADGRVLAGSTEEDVGFEKRTTPDAVADLTAFAYQIMPTLREAIVERSWAGLRPASPGGVPFIGPLPGWRNLVVAAGHFRAGVQLSVGTARLVVDMLMGRPTGDVSAFAPGREGVTIRPAFRS